MNGYDYAWHCIMVFTMYYKWLPYCIIELKVPDALQYHWQDGRRNSGCIVHDSRQTEQVSKTTIHQESHCDVHYVYEDAYCTL